ncbi:MAG: diaminopimelate epimerase [Planctomycetota bacterium]
MQFTKMHGIGNDYVVIERRDGGRDDLARLARRIADRHLGIGSDGLIVLGPPRPGVEADVRMRMLNPDGSEAEMCGNGVRCACKHAHDSGLCRTRPMRVETGAGVLELDYELDDRSRVAMVSVDMGRPVLAASRLPVRWHDDGPVVDAPLERLLGEPAPAALADAADGAARVTCVSTGNPHAVIFCREIDDLPLGELGPWLERHPAFPSRVNVHFVRVDAPTAVTMRTWERGAGATLACGTGACAVCVAAVLTGRAEHQIEARLPGGSLRIRWDPATDRVVMTGPAEEVFTGQWPDVVP